MTGKNETKSAKSKMNFSKDIYYKIVDKNLTSFYGYSKFKIGEETKKIQRIKICERGYHVCKNLTDVFNFIQNYHFINDNYKILKVKINQNNIIEDNMKICADILYVVDECNDYDKDQVLHNFLEKNLKGRNFDAIEELLNSKNKDKTIELIKNSIEFKRLIYENAKNTVSSSRYELYFFYNFFENPEIKDVFLNGAKEFIKKQISVFDLFGIEIPERILSILEKENIKKKDEIEIY